MSRLIVVLSVVMVVVVLSELVTGAPSDASHQHDAMYVPDFVIDGLPSRYPTTGALTSHGGSRPLIYSGNHYVNRYNWYNGYNNYNPYQTYGSYGNRYNWQGGYGNYNPYHTYGR
ncbi:uncharacterized protein LOC135116508 [Scylla paramamosain]|uniref:uncharacterized protein LOC135116508 n=1 Tax=Scylla paramamosain TaxID=85552 RepID=UPI0030835A68